MTFPLFGTVFGKTLKEYNFSTISSESDKQTREYIKKHINRKKGGSRYYKIITSKSDYKRITGTNSPKEIRWGREQIILIYPGKRNTISNHIRVNSIKKIDSPQDSKKVYIKIDCTEEISDNGKANSIYYPYVLIKVPHFKKMNRKVRLGWSQIKSSANKYSFLHRPMYGPLHDMI